MHLGVVGRATAMAWRRGSVTAPMRAERMDAARCRTTTRPSSRRLSVGVDTVAGNTAQYPEDRSMGRRHDEPDDPQVAGRTLDRRPRRTGAGVLQGGDGALPVRRGG